MLHTLQRISPRLQGRASRSEWWLSILTINVGVFLLVLAGYVAGKAGVPEIARGIYILAIAFGLTAWLPVTARRLHDLNRSGWWAIIGLVPLIGSVFLLTVGSWPSAPLPYRRDPAAPLRAETVVMPAAPTMQRGRMGLADSRDSFGSR